MVKRIFSFLSKEISGLHEAAYLLACATVLSQLLALVRDKLLAATFGAGQVLDLYYASFRFSDLIYATIASTVSASILVPFLIKKCPPDRQDCVDRHFIDHVFSAFFFIVIIVAIILFFIMPYMVDSFFPGYVNSPQLPMLITASRIMLLSPIFLGISNFFASIAQLYNRFLIYAVSPLLYNLGIIIGTVVLYPMFGFYGLTAGVILGAAMHMGLQIPFVVSRGLTPRLWFPIDWKEVREVVLVAFPRTLTLSSAEIAEFFLISFATVMGTGAVSIFNFAYNLQSVPLAIVGVSYSSAAFPALAKLFESGSIDKYVQHVATTAKHVIFWSMPVTVFFIVLRANIVRTILGAGRFDWSDTRLTAAMLALFTISVAGQSLILLFVRSYYAEGKTRRPLLVNVISAVSIIAFAFILKAVFEQVPAVADFVASLFKVQGIDGSIVMVLALAYTLGNLLNTYLHWQMFQNDHPEFTGLIVRTMFDCFCASVLGGYVAFMALRWFTFFDMHKTFGVFMQGFLAGIVGLIVWLLVLKALKNKELSDVWKTLHRKIWKARILGADMERV